MPIPVEFQTLRKHYPKEGFEDLYRSLGWDDLINKPSYRNTCAVRLCLSLIRAGRGFTRGNLKILKGPHKGEPVLIRAKDLALRLRTRWGEPRKVTMTSEDDLARLGDGVVVFWSLPGGYPTHIDIMDTASVRLLFWRFNAIRCGLNCYPGSENVWHWGAA